MRNLLNITIEDAIEMTKRGMFFKVTDGILRGFLIE